MLKPKLNLTTIEMPMRHMHTDMIQLRRAMTLIWLHRSVVDEKESFKKNKIEMFQLWQFRIAQITHIFKAVFAYLRMNGKKADDGEPRNPHADLIGVLQI